MTMRGVAGASVGASVGVGVLASALVTGLAGCGARVAVLPESAQPSNLAITRDGRTVYVVDSNPFGASGSVIPIRVVGNSPGKPVKVGRFPFGIAIDP
jgi:DNA-binding beta-propeller fold protein YncE